MSRRRRWQNVKGLATRVTDAREKLLVGAASAAAMVVAPFLRSVTKVPPRDILVLRLDRIGDVLMSLPALHALRETFPEARIRLAAGRWSLDVARDAPVDEVIEWSAPWVGRASEGAVSMNDLLARARRFGTSPPDVAIDLQGDVRAIWLMALTGARRRVGYANTGSRALLTDVVALDEDVSFVEQNYRAIDAAVGHRVVRAPFRWLDEERRRRGKARLAQILASGSAVSSGPVVGIHPGAGRAIKEWPIDRFATVAKHLHADVGARFVVTGSASEKPRTAALATAIGPSAVDQGGAFDLPALAEIIAAFDVFLSGDTSAMHFACALGTPSVAIFGPSDPGRYFSGGVHGFDSGGRHVALAPLDLWCAPCNLIRRPPQECAAAPLPDCLAGIDADRVTRAMLELLDTSPR